MHHGTFAHFTLVVCQQLYQDFLHRWTGRDSGFRNLPTRSSDLIPLNFYLRVKWKDQFTEDSVWINEQLGKMTAFENLLHRWVVLARLMEVQGMELPKWIRERQSFKDYYLNILKECNDARVYVRKKFSDDNEWVIMTAYFVPLWVYESCINFFEILCFFVQLIF